MKVIGLTGSVGSGKSTIAKLLEQQYHAYLILTDDVAKQQMQPGGISYESVVALFGTSILDINGEINRTELAKLVFADPERLKQLNGITHPNVLNYVLETISTIRDNHQYPLVVVETALLIEAGYESFCDEVWYVTVNDSVRRQRLKDSRGYSDEKIDSILQNQLNDEEYRKHATIIIENNDTIDKMIQFLDNLLVS